MDKYGDAIYLTPMVLGGSRRCSPRHGDFSGFARSETTQTTLDALCGLPGRIRKIDNEAELAAIEDDVDAVLRAQLLKSAEQEEGASDATVLIAAAYRIDNLIHHRRTLLLAARG